MSHIEITLPNEGTGPGSKIVVDGNNMTSQLSGVALESRVGEPNRATLVFRVVTGSIDAEARITHRCGICGHEHVPEEET